MIARTDINLDLFVREDDPHRCRFVEASMPESGTLPEGEVLVRIEKFGFSANNITYAVLGKSAIVNYFDFFPTDEVGWGRVPVWGMGTIAESRHPELGRGERMYGYFPLARYTCLRPARLTTFGFEVDRGGLPAVYNQYTLVRSDPFYLPAKEDAMIVFRPLALTSILLDDFIAEGHGYFGAESVVIASASSKTSFALAFMLSRRASGRVVIGLTSERHAPFADGLGLYARVVTYEDIGGLSNDRPALFVDVAGNAGVSERLRELLGSNLKATITVGISHWDKVGGAPVAATSKGADQTLFFFAPAWVEKRLGDWGAAELGRRIGEAWQEFMGGVDNWVHIVRGEGRDAVASVYKRMVDGQCGPGEAHVLSLWEDAFTTRTV